MNYRAVTERLPIVGIDVESPIGTMPCKRDLRLDKVSHRAAGAGRHILLDWLGEVSR
ncbi:hypothetical protein SDC9_165607 [bioreactor metagenome]|uniref:Uncharacterized protein n=1 Tax=bioreactor metagenome TaxID=1076179 RepID=A0A645FUR4_9ZZZZ